jgi:phosphate transport system substrate-binding protein
VNRRLLLIAFAEAVLVFMGIYGYTTAYAPQQSVVGVGTEPVTLTGAGASLSFPLLSAATATYRSLHPGTAINYEPLGSEAGITQLTAETVDFCVTYPPMTQAQRNKAPGLPLHIPESISAVVLAYNIPGITNLRLTGNLTAHIFLGNVTTWNDPQIMNVNPGQNLPNKRISTWHMSEGEGTTFVFTSYLYQVSSDWRNSGLSFGTSVDWGSLSQKAPNLVQLSVLTDAGVASLMTSTPYSVGYMELSYAIQSNLSYASLQNSEGNYITPSEASAQAALQSLSHDLPATDGDWTNVNLLDEPGINTYPLVTFTYFIIYKDLSILKDMDLAKAKALVGFIWYLVHDGQSLGSSLGYVPLPANVVDIDEIGIRSVVFQGQTLI